MEIVWPGKELLKESTQKAIQSFLQTRMQQETPQLESDSVLSKGTGTGTGAGTSTCTGTGVLRPHLLMCSDNLIGLQELARRGESFHLMYIDPPYNSGQNFSFSDKAHSGEDGWLHFLLPRLMWAHALLHETGVLFVSIDDRQMASLQILLSEVFGKQNHVATLKWKKKRKPSFLSKHVSNVIEYVLIFAKNAAKLPKLRGAPLEESTRPVLNASNKNSERIIRAGTEAKCASREFPKGIYTNRSLSFELRDPLLVSGGLVTKDCRVLGKFRVDQATLDKSLFVTSHFGLRRKVSESEKSFKHVSDECVDWPTNEDAETETKRVFGGRVFEYAKPVGMLRNILAMYQGKGEIQCLDFFAGTGSFGEAVVQQTREDGVPRRFVCVQSNEALQVRSSEKTLESEQKWKTIFELTQHRVLAACREFDDPRRVELVRFFEKAEATGPGPKEVSCLKAKDCVTGRMSKKEKRDKRTVNKKSSDSKSPARLAKTRNAGPQNVLPSEPPSADSFVGTLFDSHLH